VDFRYLRGTWQVDQGRQVVVVLAWQVFCAVLLALGGGLVLFAPAARAGSRISPRHPIQAATEAVTECAPPARRMEDWHGAVVSDAARGSGRCARRATALSRRVLPMPASPATNSSRPPPAAAGGGPVLDQGGERVPADQDRRLDAPASLHDAPPPT
jgi:hypothetical protein